MCANPKLRETLINYYLLSEPNGLFGKAHFAGNGGSIAKQYNAIQRALSARHAGVSCVRHCCAAVLGNILDIIGGMRLALTDAKSSELIIISQGFPFLQIP